MTVTKNALPSHKYMNFLKIESCSPILRKHESAASQLQWTENPMLDLKLGKSIKMRTRDVQLLQNGHWCSKSGTRWIKTVQQLINLTVNKRRSIMCVTGNIQTMPHIFLTTELDLSREILIMSCRSTSFLINCIYYRLNLKMEVDFYYQTIKMFQQMTFFLERLGTFKQFTTVQDSCTFWWL